MIRQRFDSLLTPMPPLRKVSSKFWVSSSIARIVLVAQTFSRFPAFGVDAVYDEASLGLRSKRFSMIVVDGLVKNFRVVDDASKDAATLLAELKDLKDNEGELTSSFE